MHTGRIAFSQLIDFLPKRKFDKCARRYRGNYRTRTFSCFDQYLCMAFAQIFPLLFFMISKFLNERYFSFCNSLLTVSENSCRSSCIPH
ncbi:DUF4372 domain-containing protein [bacterium]|nr:DUF4372 domain-containing protein [bacterium]